MPDDRPGAAFDETVDDPPSTATFSDEELTRLALATDPFDPFASDVIRFDDGGSDLAVALLPDWYMPAPSLRRDRRRVIVLASVAISLFVINVGGLCVTYGFPDPVWK